MPRSVTDKLYTRLAWFTRTVFQVDSPTNDHNDQKTLDERLIGQETLLEGSMDCEFDITCRYLKGFLNKNTTFNKLAKRMHGNKWMRFSVLSSLRQSTYFNWLIHSWYCNPRKTAAGRRSRMWGDDCTCSAPPSKGPCGWNIIWYISKTKRIKTSGPTGCVELCLMMPHDHC